MTEQSEKKTYSVLIPIAGHIAVVVEADDEDQAIDKALDSDFTIDDLESWEALRQFNQGNVCYCPHPWEAEAIEQ